MKNFTVLIVFAGGLLAGATAQAQPVATLPGWLRPAMQQAGEQVFKDHCAACHAPRAGAAFGPSLAGVVGRRAGSLPGFPYSQALATSGLIWTEANLLKWIANNKQMVPGTVMPHPSITDPAEAAYIVAYLKTLGSSTRT